MDKGRADGVFGALLTAFLDMRGRVVYIVCFGFSLSFSFPFLRVSAMKGGWRGFMKYERYLYENTPAVHYYYYISIWSLLFHCRLWLKKEQR